MRMLLASALTLLLVSLAPPVLRAVPSHVRAQTAAQGIDSSKAKFVLISCDESGSYRLVFGVVSKEIDLSLELTAKEVLGQGARFAQERCPKPGQFENIKVLLRWGDPSTLTDDKFYKGDRNEDPNQFPRLDLLIAAYPDAVVTARNYDAEKFTWFEYDNIASDSRREAARIRLANEKEMHRQQLIAQQREADRAAVRREQSEIAARSAAFVKTNGVKRFVTIQQLTANPFVYQGQVVAIACDFIQMNSATQGVFSSYGRVVVSGIPTARFTRPGSLVILAGRVLGNIEARPRSGLVPHLSFVGSAFCRQPGCREYAFNLK
jgi:hypothetical protein